MDVQSLVCCHFSCVAATKVMQSWVIHALNISDPMSHDLTDQIIVIFIRYAYVKSIYPCESALFPVRPIFLSVKVHCRWWYFHLVIHHQILSNTPVGNLFVAVISRLLFVMVAVNFTVSGHACIHFIHPGVTLGYTTSECDGQGQLWLSWIGRQLFTPLRHYTFAIIKSLVSVKEVGFRTFVLTYLLVYRWHFSSPKTRATQQSAGEGAGGGRGEGGNLCPLIVSLSTPLSPLCQEDWQYSPPTLTFKMFHPSLRITQLWTR